MVELRIWESNALNDLPCLLLRPACGIAESMEMRLHHDRLPLVVLAEVLVQNRWCWQWYCDHSKRNKMQHGMQAVGVEPNELLVVVPVPRWL